MISKNGPIRTLFAKILALGYKSCLADARGEGGRLNADNCGQGGGWVKNWQNFLDVFYGWPLKLMGVKRIQ